MHRIGIVLVSLPGVLRDILRESLSAQPDMEIVDTVSSLASLPTTLRWSVVEAVLVGTDAPDSAAPFRALLEARPRIKVLAVAADGHKVVLHELRPRAESLGEVSPQDLLDAIRSAVLPTVA